MKKPWSESTTLIPWMILIAIILFIAVLLKENILSLSSIGSKKDFIDSISKIVTIFAIIIGGILSYLKFFKGRVLKPKLDILPTVGLIELEKNNLHWIDIELQNKGSVAIWNYKLKITALLHGRKSKEIEVNNIILQRDTGKNPENLIDVGESAYEHGIVYVPKYYYAITFNITITEQTGAIWYRYISSANQEKHEK